MAATADSRRALRPLGVGFGALGSLLAHGFVYLLLDWAHTMPVVDFEVQMPMKAQFGLSEPSPPPEASGPSVPIASATAGAAPVEAPAAPKPRPKPRKHVEAADAGARDAGGAGRDAAAVAAKDAGQGDAGPPLLAAFAPAGTQIALRLHVGRIRGTDLAEDVAQLLDALPDWRMLVDGSGLDPLRDLERLYLASPDLQRESVVIAGEYTGGEDVPRHAVESLAKARGVSASFRKQGSIQVAPWANADDTQRLLALIAPHQFAITRPEDLPRVLQVAHALALRAKKQHPGEVDPGDALLGLSEGEILALSVEGAEQFVRGNLAGVPSRLEISVRRGDEGTLEVVASGDFANARAAKRARDYWEQTRDTFAASPLVAFIGLRQPLSAARFEIREAQLAVRTVVTDQQARVLLGFVRGMFSPRDDRRTEPAAPDAPKKSLPGLSPPAP
ncbi:MAG: hypothetical protein ACHQ53_14120 [Polyangiales bacterium]